MKSRFIKRLFSVVIVCCLCIAVFLPRADSAVDMDEAAVQYSDLCAGCHSNSGASLFPNKNNFTSVNDLMDAYSSEGVHGAISCGSDCIENTNSYIWLVLWTNTPDESDIETVADLYSAKCASCHGESATNAFPNLVSFTSAEALINVYDDVTPHSNVEDCEDNCIEIANTYIWETLWGNGLSAAELYTLKCASCHGVSAGEHFPNRAAFTSETGLITVYGDVDAHDHVETCGATCIESTNTYVWYALWDRADHENTGCFIYSMKGF